MEYKKLVNKFISMYKYYRSVPDNSYQKKNNNTIRVKEISHGSGKISFDKKIRETYTNRDY